jgi:hypothetical protein
MTVYMIWRVAQSEQDAKGYKSNPLTAKLKAGIHRETDSKHR